jgi:hypothetical protein
VADTRCDVLAKDENIRVFASKADSAGAGMFVLWRGRNALLFRYDPGSPDNPLPLISRPTESTILISISHVSSILEQKHEWEGLSVNYNIGTVDYP